MNKEQVLFSLIKASLFTNNDIEIQDWENIFVEMTDQSIAALPGEWLKLYLPSARKWISYCLLNQGNWIRVIHGQKQLIELLESHNIPSVIIKGSAAAMYYQHPTLRTMGDVDILVKRSDIDKAALIMEENGYILTLDKNPTYHHYNYQKDGISFELHRKLAIVDENDEEFLALIEKEIDNRVWHEIEGYRFPTFTSVFNGLVLIFHIDQHLREGLGLRQIIDWMMYVNNLSSENWDNLILLLRNTGVERLALTTTAMCQKYLGLRTVVDDSTLPIDNLMTYVMEKGNFGRKAGIEGKTASFSLSATEKGGFFKRLQSGGLGQWKAAQKYKALRPFAWIYQSFRIFDILIKNRIGIKKISKQKKKGQEYRKLIESLGLNMDRTVKHI